MDLKEDLVQAKIYSRNLGELSGMVDTLLGEFKNAYTFAKLYPNNSEYTQQFQGVLNRLSTAVTETFNVSNNVLKSTEEVNSQLFILNKLIQDERQKNRQLKKKLGYVENQNNTSEQLIDNYTEIYNINYLRNWSLLLSTILCMFAIKTIYK